uniref:Endonuclease/exonuclease/phosphatase domain-containing protein n=1 Tax=Plectus sambesii TaxID=2011161 RepID=A0A914UJJ6_9BILA
MTPATTTTMKIDSKSTPLLNFCTFNARSLLDAGQLADFEDQAARIDFDVIGLSEVRRRGTARLDLSSGYSLFYSGESNQSRNGVGFYMTQNWTARVLEFVPVSSRIASVLLDLDSHKTIRLVQVYAPTTAYNNDVIKSFYEDLDGALRGSSTATHTIIMGDFNAKVGQQIEEERATSQFGRGECNKRGQMLVDFCEARQTVIGNTLFKKGSWRKWTWRSANGETLNEINFVLSSHREIFIDVSVLNKFTRGSDHHLVRATITIQGSRTRWHQLARWRVPRKPAIQRLNPAIYWYAIEDFMRSNATQIASEELLAPTKITEETRQLLKKRQESKKTRKMDIKYAELCKLIRKWLNIDLNNWQLSIVTSAIKNNRGLRKVCQQLSTGTHPMIAIRLADGRVRHDRKSLLEEVQ